MYMSHLSVDKHSIWGKKDEQLDLLVVIKDFLKLLSMIVLDHH